MNAPKQTLKKFNEKMTPLVLYTKTYGIKLNTKKFPKEAKPRILIIGIEDWVKNKHIINYLILRILKRNIEVVEIIIVNNIII